MSDAPVELVLLWHHHQPDYRMPQDGRSVLPWVRLHGTKDYLDMAVRLERYPAIRCAFNFVPSLLDQLEEAAHGGGDTLFDRLRRSIADLKPEDLDEIRRRCSVAPRHALERWPAYRIAMEKVRRSGNSAQDRDWIRLETWFLLAWLDPTQLVEPEARAALDAAPDFTIRHRDDLLDLYSRLLGRVVPEYAELARTGRVELSASPYYHPILPLLIDVASARRARQDVPLPREPFAAPEDARLQIERALDRHERAFGDRPRGMWPPEGSVSPEALEIAAQSGVKWMATDEAVLWNSLEPGDRRREALYQPWRFATDAGEVALFFRDHELSDRIGFVYQHWRTDQAVEDFIERVRRVGRGNPSPTPHVVSVILDGENCWEHYPDDGGPFLDALYAALTDAKDIVTRTPSDVLDAHTDLPLLRRLHTGSWIDADFHIWIGHPEKNRAWELIARTRRALEAAGATPATAPTAWESLLAAEGSDWFWWFGDDHFTPDKPLFDHLFRSHLRAAHERANLPVPNWLDVPIVKFGGVRNAAEREPCGFIHPVIDGRRTGFYEWHGSALFRLGAGGSAMHQGAGLAEELHFGYDESNLFVRIDFEESPPGEEYALLLEVLAPSPVSLEMSGLAPGNPVVRWRDGARRGQPVAGARAAIERLIEVSVPFESLGLASGQSVEMIARLLQRGQPVETIPGDDVVRFRVPEPSESERMWSA